MKERREYYTRFIAAGVDAGVIDGWQRTKDAMLSGCLFSVGARRSPCMGTAVPSPHDSRPQPGERPDSEAD